jgi:hypothetical protein
MLASEDLVVQALRAVIVAKVEARIPVLVLDHELDSHVTRCRAHAFQLERCIVAGEHTTIAVASVVDEAAGFLRRKREALAASLECDDELRSGTAHFLIRPACAISEALGFSALDAEGEHAGDRSEDRGCLHFCFCVGGLVFRCRLTCVEDDGGKTHSK